MYLCDALADHNIRLRDLKPGEHKIICPRCSHTRKKKSEPCLSVKIDDDGGAVWNCWHCEWAGNVPGGAREAVGVRERRRTYRRPAPDHSGVQDEPMYAWFRERGISRATVDGAGISIRSAYIPAKGERVKAIAFPFYRGADLINVKYRTREKEFAQEKDAEPIWYGLNDVQGCETAVVVEGELDKLAFAEAGVGNVISVPTGAPSKLRNDIPQPEDDAKFAFMHNCADDLAHVGRYIIAVDNDDKGHVLAEELARRLGKERCWRVTWPTLNDIPVKDANDVLLAHGPEVLCEMVEHATPYPVHGLFELRVDDLIELRKRPVDRGISTGWPKLDPFYRVVPGQLTIVTGLPNSGKSEFLDAVMVNIAIEKDWNFAVCSLENPVDEHGGKLAEKYLGQPFRQYSPSDPPMTDAALRTAGEWVRDHFVFIHDDGENPVGVDWVLERARVAVKRYGIRGLVLDPYNEFDHRRPSNVTETEYISLLLSKLKRFAQRNGVHVWLIAHPAKMYSEKGQPIRAPGLYDISGSAHFANKADVGITVHRPDPTTPNAEIHVRKVRFKHVGKIGCLNMRWEKSTGRYEAIS